MSAFENLVSILALPIERFIFVSNFGASKAHLGVFEDAPASDFLGMVNLRDFDWRDLFSKTGEYIKKETITIPTEIPPCEVRLITA